MKTKSMTPCFAFYDLRCMGFLMYQDGEGQPVARGEIALQRWRDLGRPNVTSLAEAERLGLVIR